MSNETEEIFEKWKDFFEERGVPYSSHIIFSLSLLVVFFSSLVVNILICIVIYYDKTMHTATNYYLFDLAVSDLLITFQMLIVIYQILTPENALEYTTGVMTIQIYVCMQSTFLSLLWNHATLVMTALSIERYIAICYPMMLLSTPVWKRVCKIILALWVIAIIETLPMIWTFSLVDTGNTLRCSILMTSTATIISGCSIIITFILPLGIMMYVYAMIAFKINYHQKYNLNKMVVHNSNFKRRNVNRLIIALLVSFMVCWMPTYILWMLLFFTDQNTIMRFQMWFSVGHKIAMFNNWLTTVLNPLLFSLISVKFRKAFKMLWDKRIKRRYFETKKNTTVGREQIILHSVLSRET